MTPQEPRRDFPIMASLPDRRRYGSQLRASIPWAMIEPHRKQAAKNHGGQSLERLADRGGLAPDEAIAVLEDRAWTFKESLYARARLEELVRAWEARPV